MDTLTPCTLSSSVTSSAHAEGIILLDLAAGKLFASNRTGALIWHGIEQGQAPATIAEDLSRRYHITLERAQACTAQFVAQLVAHRLLHVRSER